MAASKSYLLSFFHHYMKNRKFKAIMLLGNGQRFSCMVGQAHVIYKSLCASQTGK